MSDEIAISVQNVSKSFRLPHEKQTSLKSAFLNSFRPKSYETHTALKDISFDIKKGEFFGIVGRNGSGKSTLLKCIAGVYVPNKGEIKINGRLVPFIELGVGFNPELTGRDNVYLNGALLGFSRKQIAAMYDDIVEFAELEQFMDQKLKNYSSGMQVRLAFSIAIRAEGDILLLDEVLAVGDSAFQRKCLDYFKEVKKTHKTVILVSHSMGTVQEFCDRAMMIEDAKIVGIGSPIKIAAQYEMANSIYAAKPLGKKVKPDQPKTPPKNPELKITRVTVNNHDKKSTDFDLNDDVQIDVEVEVYKKIPFYLNLVISNMDGEYIAGINTKQNLKDLDLPKGKHQLRCTLAAGQFAVGPYNLTINAVSDSDNEALIDIASHEYGTNLPTITFTEKSLYKKGKFYMNADWQLKS